MLRAPYYDESSLKANISRLAIALEAHAISSAPLIGSPNDASQGPGVSQGRDVIWSGRVDVGEDPLIVVEESDDGHDGQNVLLIWKLAVFLSSFFTTPSNWLALIKPQVVRG